MAALLSLCLTGCGDTRENADKSTAKTTKKESFAEKKDAGTSNSQYLTGKHHAEIVIAEYGKLELELDADVAPITVTNFVNLAKKGFYNGLTFHRIMSGFMIQGGDPNGDGTGGSEETIKGEFKSNGIENTMSHKRGVISMARTQNDPDSASSQFFIVQADSDFLDGDYAAFGKVTAGMDIVDKICQSVQPIDNNGTVPADQQPKITAIKVID
jgi:peptidyl-prolyl cis-trans isomerase